MVCYSVPLITLSNSIRLTYSSLYRINIVFFWVPEPQISNTFRCTSSVKDSAVFWRSPWHRKKKIKPGNEASVSFRYVGNSLPKRTTSHHRRRHSHRLGNIKCPSATSHPHNAGSGQYILCRPSSTVLAALSLNISRWKYDSLCGILKQTSRSCKKCSAYSVRQKTIFEGRWSILIWC